MKWICYFISLFLMFTAITGMVKEGPNINIGERILAMMLISVWILLFTYIFPKEFNKK